MAVFATPQPVTLTIELGVANLRIIASQRRDTVVEVSPSDAASASDLKATAQTRVEYHNGRLLVKGPRPRFHLFRSESVDVTIELPAGSNVYGTILRGEFRTEGLIGECRFYTAMGNLSLEQTGKLNLNTGYGNITVERAVGNADITTGSGLVRIGEIEGTATIKNSDGTTAIGKVSDELRFYSANGAITIDHACSSVTAKTAVGSIHIGEAVRGSILLETAYGALEVGIRKGTAAWLDVSTEYGSVRNSLKVQDGPGQADERLEVRARTAYGNITLQRVG